MDIPHSRSLHFTVDGTQLEGELAVPERPVGVVLFATGSVNSPGSSVETTLAETLNQFGLATVVTDLLSVGESADRATRSDVELLSSRLAGQFDWLDSQPQLCGFDPLVCGVGTGAAAAVDVVVERAEPVGGMALLNGRVDLTRRQFETLEVPLLFHIESTHSHLRDDNMDAYMQAGTPESLKHFLSGVDRESLSVLARWLHSNGTTKPHRIHTTESAEEPPTH